MYGIILQFLLMVCPPCTAEGIPAPGQATCAWDANERGDRTGDDFAIINGWLITPRGVEALTREARS